MNMNKIMIVSLILLAIFAIGAVSASESTDVLSVDDNDGLSVDESPEDVVADSSREILSGNETSSNSQESGNETSSNSQESGNETSSSSQESGNETSSSSQESGNESSVSSEVPGDVQFNYDDNHEFSTSQADSESVINVEFPLNYNGSFVVSSGNQVFYNKELKDIVNSWKDDSRNVQGIGICNDELSFFNGLSSGDIVKLSFTNNDNQIFSNYATVQFNDDSTNFALKRALDTWFWNEWDGPLYLDTHNHVINIYCHNPAVEGTFYVTVNGREYKYLPYFDEENGEAYHNWVLSSFDINSAGSYPLTVKFTPDGESTSEIICTGVLNVVEFNNDALRLIVDYPNQQLKVFCPENIGGVISIFLKHDWGDEFPEQADEIYEIAPGDYNAWKIWTPDDFGWEKDSDFIYKICVNGTNGTLLEDEGSFWFNEPWVLNSEIKIDMREGDFSKDNGEDTILGISIPEKAGVYNGIVEIKNGATTLYSKEISTKYMNFFDIDREYSYDIFYDDLKDKLVNLNNALLTFSFRYNDTSVNYPFVMVKVNNKKNYEVNLESCCYVDVFNEKWTKGPLYSDYIDEVVQIDVHSNKIKGIFYVTANDITYKYLPFFDDDGNSHHYWVLSSFNITEAGAYPVLVEYANDETSEPSVICKDTLNVIEFNNDAFRVIKNNPNRSIEIFCPEGSEGSIIKIFVKTDWDSEYPANAFKTIEVTSDMYNEWVSVYYSNLGVNIDNDCICQIEISNGTQDVMSPVEINFWYDGEPPYEIFAPSDIMFFVSSDDFRSDNDENDVVELCIPEKTFIYNGTLKITSNANTLYSKSISVADMEFNDDGRYYNYVVDFDSLNIKNLKSGDIVTISFTNDVKSVEQKLFFNKWDEDGESVVKFNGAFFKEANVLRDDDVIQIADFPIGVDDEFIIFIDTYSSEKNITCNISELTRNDAGFYTWNCTALGLDVLMDDLSDAEFEYRIVFYRNGDYSEEVYGSPLVFKNPFIFSGEIDEDEEEGIIWLNVDDLRSAFADEFIVHIIHNGTESNLTFDLGNMDQYSIDDEEIFPHQININQLGINERGEYEIVMEFTTKTGEKVQYSSSIEVVDFVIATHGEPESITDPVFRILLTEDAEGKVVILVNGTEKFNDTLEYIGYSHWNRMGGFNIPLNYLQIFTSGQYDVEVQVYDNNSVLLRNVTETITVNVGTENKFEFEDMIYGIGDDIVKSELTVPVPIDTRYVLYINGKETLTRFIDCNFAFGVEDLDKSFFDAMGNLKPGTYTAAIKMINGDTESEIANATFKVLETDGTSKVTIPSTGTTTAHTYISLYLPEPEDYCKDNAAIRIFIDPEMNEDGDIDSVPFFEKYGYDIEQYWGATKRIDLGILSEGNHRVIVQYLMEFRGDYDKSNFVSKFATIKVNKVSTNIAVSNIKTTYNSGKYLVATLKDAKNNPLKNVYVKVIIGGKTVKIKTNSKGQIKYLVSNLKVSKKAYNVVLTFDGNAKYLKTTKTVKVTINKAKPKLKVSVKKYKAKVKAKKYTVTVKTGKYPLKSVKVTLKVKGKTYNAKTNKKGVATFKVTKLNKKGKYKAVINLPRTANFNAVKKSVVIVVK